MGAVPAWGKGAAYAVVVHEMGGDGALDVEVGRVQLLNLD